MRSAAFKDSVANSSLRKIRLLTVQKSGADRFARASYGGIVYCVPSSSKNTNEISQKYFEGDLSGTIWKLPEGDLKFAVGVDYRGDSFTYRADPSLNPAFNVMPAPIPPDIIRCR